MKNYFNFRVRGLQLFAVCIGYLLCIVAGGYSGMTISMHYTQAAAMAAVPPAICTVSDRMAANRKRFSFRISALGTM